MDKPLADADYRSLFGDTYTETEADWKRLHAQTPADAPRRVPLGFNSRCTTPQIDVAHAGVGCWIDVQPSQTRRPVTERKTYSGVAPAAQYHRGGE